jgi:hypothetical protein
VDICWAWWQYLILDGSSAPLFIGGDCSVCQRPVCPSCSLFYTHRFCFECLSSVDQAGTLAELPPPVVKEYQAWASQHARWIKTLQQQEPPAAAAAAQAEGAAPSVGGARSSSPRAAAAQDLEKSEKGATRETEEAALRRKLLASVTHKADGGGSSGAAASAARGSVPKRRKCADEPKR